MDYFQQKEFSKDKTDMKSKNLIGNIPYFERLSYNGAGNRMTRVTEKSIEH